MGETITVATANTQYGRLLTTPDGLRPLNELGADVLLLQEVLGLSPQQISERLGMGGFAVAHAHPSAGLVIAHRPEAVTTVGTYVRELQPISAIGRVLQAQNLPTAQRFRSRALIAARLKMAGGAEITVATAHPIVFARPLTRRHQVAAIGQTIDTMLSPESNFVAGIDMNHFPTARGSDRYMMRRAGLKRVSLDEPTWFAEGSRHEQLLRGLAVIARRDLASYDAELDAMVYRGPNLRLQSSEVIDIASDHRSIVGRFTLENTS